ncbi:chromate efflux transporter [Novosphingobium bradum]|uniref:Chromate efflux transporter n=1 Tax=Novosphingobium bradum TaxID=1737444 RepID=A0ABV7INC2_9SPHN
MTEPTPSSSTTPSPTFAELVRVSTRIGCLSFGGPAGQIALMHRELVEERGWVSEEQYLHALNFCHLLPGPEAQQLAIWIGWKLHGLKGGLASGLLFVVPGALVMLALSMLYGFAAKLGWFAALFLGIKAAVLAVVVQALLRVARRALNTAFKRAVAVVALLALFVFNLPFPVVVLGALALGTVIAARRPAWLALGPMAPASALAPRPWGATIRAIAVGGLFWSAPLVLVFFTLGQSHVLWEIGSFFARLAVVSFGGAYAVLAYMAQAAVQTHGWLGAGEMADGLGLAETTPGPLIMVTQFVGYLAAFRAPAPFTPLTAGLLGAAITTWVTFAPCFLWVFALAPWIERLEHARRLKGGLATLTAAIVGVIGNLSLWFALHVLFARVATVEAGPLRLLLPDPASLDWRALVLAVVAGLLVFRLRWNVIAVIGLAAAGGLVLGQLG